MGLDVTALAVEIKSKGIKESADALKEFTKAAEGAEKANSALGKSSSNTASTSKSAVAAAQATAQAMAAKASAMNSAASAAGGLNTSLKSTSEALKTAASHGSVWSNTLRSMGVAMAAYAAINLAKSIVNEADAWQLQTARLKMATGSMEGAKAAQEDLFQLAQKLRVPLAEVTQLYTRMSLPLQEMGKSQAEVLRMTEGVSLALKINGSTAAESASVMLQFSQSVAAGRLNGAEFNAVAEGARPILAALVAELRAVGKEVDFGALKKMGADGKISVELMNAAIERALPQWRKDFESLPITVEGAMTRVKNAWLKAMGEMGEDTQLNKKIAEMVKSFEDAIPAIRDNLATAVIFLMDNAKTLTFILGSLVALKLATWAYEAAAAVKVLNIAMATNPIGLAIAGITAAITLGMSAWALWGSETKSAAEKGSAAVTTGSVGVIKALEETTAARNREIAAIEKKRNLEANPGEVEKYATPLENLQKELQLVLKMEGAYKNTFGSERQALIAKFGNMIVSEISSQEKRERQRSTIAIENINKEGAARLQAFKDKTPEGVLEAKKKEYDAMLKAGLTQDKYNKLLSIATDEYNKANKSGKEYTKELSENEKAMEKIRGTALEYRDALDQALTSDSKRLKADKELTAAQNHLSEALSSTTNRYSAQDIATAKAGVTQAQQNLVYAEAVEQQAAYNQALEESNKAAIRHQEITFKDIDKIQETNQKLKDQINTFGMTEGAIQDLMAVREESILLSMKEQGYSTVAIHNQQQIIDGLKEQAQLKSTLQGKELDKKANEDSIKEWNKTVDKYQDIFQKGFMDMLATSKGSWKSFTQSIVNTFKTSVADQIYKMFVQPFVVKVIANLVGSMGGSVGGNALGSISNGMTLAQTASAGVSGMISSLGSVASAAGTMFGSSAVSAFGAGMQGSTLAAGLAGPTTAGATGAMGAGASMGTSLMAAAPYIAAILAAYAIHKATQGETRAGGQYGYSFSGTDVVNQRRGTTQYASGVGSQFLEGPSGGDPFAKEAKAAINATVESINKTLKAVGSAATLIGFSAGYESSDKGRGGVFAGGTLTGGVGFGESGRGDNYAGTLYESTSAQSLSSEDAIKNFALDLQQTTIQALQAAIDVPSTVKAIIAGIDAETLTSEAASGIIKQIDDLVSTVTAFRDAANQLPFDNLKNMSFDLAASLIAAAGGIGNLDKNLSSYYTNFYDESEKSAKTVALVTEALQSIGKEMPTTRDGFRALVEAEKLLTPESQKTYTTLLSVADAFASVTPLAIEAATEITTVGMSIQDIADQAKSLQDQYDELTMTSTELRAKEKLAIHATNEALFDSITALQLKKIADEEAAKIAEDLAAKVVKDAEEASERIKEAMEDATSAYASAINDYVDAQKSARGGLKSLGDTVLDFANKVKSADANVASAKNNIAGAYFSAQDAVTEAQKTLLDVQKSTAEAALDAAKGLGKFAESIDEFLGSLKTTTLGSGSPTTQLEALREQFTSLSSAASSGDIEAQGKLVGVAQSFLQASKDYNASGAGFTSDEAFVKATMIGLKTLAQTGGIEIKIPVEMVAANERLAEAQSNLAKYAALANTTGTDISRRVSTVDVNIASLLEAYDSSVSVQSAAARDYRLALDLTRGLALTSSDSLTGLRAGVAAYSASIAALAKAASDLAAASQQRAAAGAASGSGFTVWNTPTMGPPAPVDRLTTQGPTAADIPLTPAPMEDAATVFIRSLYKTIAGKDIPDEAGMDWWLQKYAEWGAGRTAMEFQTAVNGSHRNGLNEVPYDNYVANLHQGERVLTASQASASDELVQLTKQVLNALDEMKGNTGAVLNQNAAVAEMMGAKLDAVAASQDKVARTIAGK